LSQRGAEPDRHYVLLLQKYPAVRPSTIHILPLIAKVEPDSLHVRPVL
jgi:hypothetical protein